jgi:hypothetical protein
VASNEELKVLSDYGLCSYLAMLPTSGEAFQLAEQRERS